MARRSAARAPTLPPSPPRRAALLRAAALAGALSLAWPPASIGVLGAAGCRSRPSPPDWWVWTTQPPEGCALGSSGATLRPGDALRQARVRALVGLLRRFERTEVRSESFDDGRERIAWTHQVSLGRLARSRVVAMWSDPGGSHAEARVYALACERGVRPETKALEHTPDWFMNPPSDEHRVCAPAVAGPTLLADDQRPAALADGRTALAEALESEILQIVVDDEGQRVFVHSSLEATEAARTVAQRADELERTWTDEEGRGPLGVSGTLYGVVCVDR